MKVSLRRGQPLTTTATAEGCMMGPAYAAGPAIRAIALLARLLAGEGEARPADAARLVVEPTRRQPVDIVEPVEQPGHHHLGRQPLEGHLAQRLDHGARIARAVVAQHAHETELQRLLAEGWRVVDSTTIVGSMPQTAATKAIIYILERDVPVEAP
jgi:hypothetical protein